MSDRTKAIIAILIVSILGGAMSPVTKIGLVKIPPFSFSFIRLFIAAVIILPFFIKAKIKFDKNYFKLLLISLLPVINIAFFVSGVKITTASIAQMLYGGTPILTGLFVLMLHKENLSFKKWLLILLGLAGVAIVVLLPLLEKDSLYAGSLQGNLLITIGVIAYSIYGVLTKKYLKLYSPFIVTSSFIFLGCVIFFVLSLLELSFKFDYLTTLPLNSVFAVIYVSIFGTLGGYTLHQYAIKHGGSVSASLSFYLLPIFAYLASFALLGERLTTGLIIGTIIVFISVALTTYTK